MIDPQESIRGAYEALLRARGLARPDGRPLYAYRFSRSEYDSLREVLRIRGRPSLGDPYGAALFVAFTAEWYRREREGGHWDWIRPLAAIRIRYRQGDGRSDVDYGDIKEAAETGLRYWARAQRKELPLLHSLIAEGGFPAASVRESPNFSSWLKRSMLAIDTGMTVEEAVDSESWRAPRTLVRVVLEPAVALCEKIAEFRALLPDAGPLADVDPVARLDRLQSDWRSALPFDVEERDVRLLVEDLVRTRRGVEASGLSVLRRLRVQDGGWTEWAELLISGDVAHGKLPHDLRAQLATASRVRIAPSGVLAAQARPLASMERVFGDDQDRWEVRPLVQGFDAPLPLQEEMRLVALAGDKIVAQFTAFSGEPMSGPVVALQPASVGAPLEAVELEVLGTSPAKTTRPWMALAVEPASVDRLKFETPPLVLGDCGARRVLAFSGRAELELDGARLLWRTGTEQEDVRRLVLVGDTVRGAKEQVYRGTPQGFLVDLEGLPRHVRPRDLVWRAIGRREWCAAADRTPLGRVEFAVREQNELVAWTRAAVVGASFRVVPNRHGRNLKVEGLDGATVAASGPAPKACKTADGTAVVDLAGHLAGAPLRVELTWSNTLSLTLDDPVAEPMLLDPLGLAVSAHARLSVGRIGGYRLLAPEPRLLSFEVRSEDGVLLHAERTTEGSVPLPAFGELVRELLSARSDLDGHMRLCWMGRGDWLAEIGWYDVDQPLHLPGNDDSPFAALRERVDSHRLTAFSLTTPGSGVARDVPLGTLAETRAVLEEKLGEGPWLVSGARLDGQRLRPRVLDAGVPCEGSNGLLRAMARPTRDARDKALDEVMAAIAGASDEEVRHLVLLAQAARQTEVPATSVDPLRALCRYPPAAVEALAACDTHDETEVVLGLQSELPLMWCATSLADWRDAFRRGKDRAKTLLASRDLPLELADIQVAAALARIVDRAPILRLHVLLTLNQLVSLAGLDRSLLSRLRGGVSRGAEEIARELVTRRADGAEPPTNLGLAAVVPQTRGLLQRFEDRFAEVLAAPFVAARMAAGRNPYEHALVRACRAARLYDPEYFEAGFVAALQREARQPEGATA